MNKDPIDWDDINRFNEIKRLREALEIIAGDRPCLDNLMGNVDVARAALES